MTRRSFLESIIFGGAGLTLPRQNPNYGPIQLPDEVPVLPSKISTDHHSLELRHGERALHYIPFDPPYLVRADDTITVKGSWTTSVATKLKGILYLYERI